MNAQPPICGNNPAMTSICKDACIICDIDGFTGRNNSNITGQAPQGFCTSLVHHMQWIGFIAGTADISIEITVFNCVDNDGLEVGLYESLDCVTFRKISECDTDIRENEVRVFTNTVPLIIGQYYYFVMDGSGGDICNYTIKVKSGSTKVLPLETAANIAMPSVVCQNENFDISTPGLMGATFYNWTLDGVLLNTTTSFKHVFDKPGKYEICLLASNVCDLAPSSCKTIEVLPVPISRFQQQVCYGECFRYEGNQYCNSGLYDIKLLAANGCDSIVTLDLIVDDRVTATTSLHICDGDTLTLGNGKFYAEGQHETIISNEEGCNIYMTLDLKLIKCNITSTSLSTPAKCNGENSGMISFKVDNGTPPFRYTGFKIENPSITFMGDLDAVNKIVQLSGLDEGNYIITILDTFGNSRVINNFVSQPPLLSSDVVTSDYNNFQVSCYGSNDGYFIIQPTGGVSPYTYKHTDLTSTSDTISNLISGTYTTVVTDSNGCEEMIITNINQPDSLHMIPDFIDPDCNGLNTGSIVVSMISGGVPPYLFSMNYGPKLDITTYNNLTEGIYSIEMYDNNDCYIKYSELLTAPEIPELIVENSDLTVMLGDSILMKVISNLSEQTIIWTPNENIGCKECLVTYALPVNDTDYLLSVISKDGCEKNVLISVKVDKKRSFTISNIISDNDDQHNDKIRYFAGKDVAYITHFSIYDRWGNLIFENTNIP
ncbi:MAG: hypothetical protein H7X99_04475, partial [Saprospiraceae bacterium]|nr:hypothetical protein [Saprospiraceae bacterium]